MCYIGFIDLPECVEAFEYKCSYRSVGKLLINYIQGVIQEFCYTTAWQNPVSLVVRFDSG